MSKYKKSLFVVCFLIITSISVFSSNVYATTSNTTNKDPNQAFTPQKDWSVASNQLNGTVMDMCADVSGNVILLVNSSDTYYIQKYDINGTQIFSEKWNATYSSKSYPTAITTDYINSIFIAGNFYNGTSKYYEPFITKCRPDGSSIWNSSVIGAAGLSESFYANAIHVGTNSIDLLMFFVQNSAGYTFRTYMYAKLDTSGNILQISSSISPGPISNYQFSASFFGNDSLIIASSCPGMTGIANSSAANVNYFNSKGNLKWQNNYVPKNSPITYGVGVDNNSQIYVLGKNYLDSNAVNSNYLYAYNLTTGLPYLWNVTTGTSYSDFSPVLSVFDSNHIYVAGVNVVSAQPIPYLERFNSNGTLIWTINITSAPAPDRLIALNTDSFLYLGTYYNNNSNELSLISPKTNISTNNNSTNNNNPITNLLKNIPGYNMVVLSITIFATVGVISLLIKRKRM